MAVMRQHSLPPAHSCSLSLVVRPPCPHPARRAFLRDSKGDSELVSIRQLDAEASVKHTAHNTFLSLVVRPCHPHPRSLPARSKFLRDGEGDSEFAIRLTVEAGVTTIPVCVHQRPGKYGSKGGSG